MVDLPSDEAGCSASYLRYSFNASLEGALRHKTPIRRLGVGIMGCPLASSGLKYRALHHFKVLEYKFLLFNKTLFKVGISWAPQEVEMGPATYLLSFLKVFIFMLLKVF